MSNPTPEPAEWKFMDAIADKFRQGDAEPIVFKFGRASAVMEFEGDKFLVFVIQTREVPRSEHPTPMGQLAVRV